MDIKILFSSDSGLRKKFTATLLILAIAIVGYTFLGFLNQGKNLISLAKTLSPTLSICIFLIIPIFFIGKCWAEEVNLYSARKEHLIKPLIDIFEKDTGIKVNLVTAKSSQLHQRILREGNNSPADVLLTTDAGNLWKASNENFFQPIIQ